MEENQMKLPNGKTITFNAEQLDGLRKIKAWLNNKETFFTLAGFAGTGKSTIIKKVLDSYNRTVRVSAPTHKAKKVIINTTGREGVTLHSLLGLRPDIDMDAFDPNRPEFSPIGKPTLDLYSFIVIDESSMINYDLFEMLKFTASGLKTKILFMGDPAQIPPIGEKESVVFFDESIQIHWLTKVERQQNGNPLLPIYDSLRNNLESIDGGYSNTTNVNENGEGIIFLNKKMGFREAVLNKFLSEEYKKNTDFVKLIAWRNDNVMASNKVIREAMFSTDAKVVVEGDVLMAYRSIMAKRAFYNIIENSADYKVMKVSEGEENEYGIWGYRVNLRENVGVGLYNFRDVFIIDSLDHNNLHQFAEMHDFFRDRGKADKTQWKNYYNFRRENMVMVTINKYRDGDTRPDKEVIIKDFDYGYALTAHKCLSENSMIQKNNGFCSLKKIEINDSVCVGNNIYRNVVDKIFVGKKKSFRLKTSFGYEIDCSVDHNILNINNQFQPLKTFKIGDYIPINRNKIDIDIDITQRDFNYYLGLLVADGSYSGGCKRDKYRIDLTIGYEDQDNIDFIRKYYSENNINFGEYRKKNCENIYVSNKVWRNKLLSFGLKYVKGSEKSVPEQIINGTLQEKSNFIAGLFDGDGSVKNRGRIRFVNNSFILIKEIQNILLEFGIISFYNKQKKAYTLNILGTSIPEYKKYISFRLVRKIKSMNDYHYTNKTNRDNIPFRNEVIEIVKNDLRQTKGFFKKNTGIYPQSFLKIPAYSKNLSYWHLENIFKLYEINNKPINPLILDIYNKHYFYDKIVSICEIGEENMYDLEIEGIHQFVANGFIVHNSQGSTYVHTMILENDINCNQKVKERNQILYVSLTRPTTSATLLTN